MSVKAAFDMRFTGYMQIQKKKLLIERSWKMKFTHLGLCVTFAAIAANSEGVTILLYAVAAVFSGITAVLYFRRDARKKKGE